MMHPSSAEPRAEQAPVHDRFLRSSATAVSSTAPGGDPGVPPTSPRVGASEDVALSSGAVAADAATLYWHAGVKARGDSPSIEQLKAENWTIEHENVWGGALMRKEVP